MESSTSLKTLVRSLAVDYIMSASGDNATIFGVQMSLDQLPAYAEITALYDQYRIDRVDATFFSPYVTDGQSATTLPANTQALLHTVNDFDDATIPGGWNVPNLQQYDTYNCHNLTTGKDVTICYKPKFATAAYSGAFTSYNLASGWVDTDSPSVQHYGLKFGIEWIFYDGGAAYHPILPSGFKQTVRVSYRIHLSLRGTR